MMSLIRYQGSEIMGENRACKKFNPTDPTYEKTNCASCTFWGGEKCVDENGAIAVGLLAEFNW